MYFLKDKVSHNDTYARVLYTDFSSAFTAVVSTKFITKLTDGYQSFRRKLVLAISGQQDANMFCYTTTALPLSLAYHRAV